MARTRSLRRATPPPVGREDPDAEADPPAARDAEPRAPLAPPVFRSASLACVSWSTSTPDRASRDAEVPNVRRKVDKRGVGGARAPPPPPSLPPPPPAPIVAYRASRANRADPAPKLGSGAPRVGLRCATSGFIRVRVAFFSRRRQTKLHRTDELGTRSRVLPPGIVSRTPTRPLLSCRVALTSRFQLAKTDKRFESSWTRRKCCPPPSEPRHTSPPPEHRARRCNAARARIACARASFDNPRVQAPSRIAPVAIA